MTDTPKTTVRPLAPSDREVWGELWHAYLDFYETTLPDAVYDSTFARLMGSDPYDPIGLIAEVDGRPVGLVHYLFHRHCWKIEIFSARQKAKTLFLAFFVKNGLF